MIRRRLCREDLAREPHLQRNACIDLVAMGDEDGLEPVQQVAHRAFWYDSEVQNGGHLQYFENYRKANYSEAIDPGNHVVTVRTIDA